jgi:pilus assembly protein Flp/PilA
MKNNKIEGNKMKVEKMKKWLSAFLKDEEGASGIEYALVAAMVAIVLVGLIPGISGSVSSIFGRIATVLTEAAGE